MPSSRIPRSLALGKPKPDLRRRTNHLIYVRQLPCTVCGKAAPSEAAHVRSGSDGGTGIKPSDRYALPLCTSCHALQHEFGELRFWATLRIDPLDVGLRLWTVSGDIKVVAGIVFRE